MLTAVFWDVQHGNAAYLGLPGGQHIVVDLGTGSTGTGGSDFSPLLYLRNRWNVHQLDDVVITHPHRDHLDDIFNFDSMSPRVLTRPRHLQEGDIRAGNQSRDQRIINKYLELDRRYSEPVEEARSPTNPLVNGGVRIAHFTPVGCDRKNLNNHSIVTVVTYAETTLLIPGDNEAPSWRELLADPHFVAAIRGTDILLAPHHGRNAGCCEDLFEHIHPVLTIISDGPALDTSATEWYAARSRGWTVHRRGGGDEERKCVTTRCDGAILVQCGYNDGRQPYLSVTVD